MWVQNCKGNRDSWSYWNLLSIPEAIVVERVKRGYRGEGWKNKTRALKHWVYLLEQLSKFYAVVLVERFCFPLAKATAWQCIEEQTSFCAFSPFIDRLFSLTFACLQIWTVKSNIYILPWICPQEGWNMILSEELVSKGRICTILCSKCINRWWPLTHVIRH